MATFKVEIYAHQKRRDGTYNVKIRVTQNTKKKYLATPFYVGKDDVTRSLKIKNQYYIDECDNLIREYRRRCDAVGIALKDWTVEQVVELITRKENQEVFDLDFLAYGKSYVERLKQEGKSGTANSYQFALNNLTRFIGRETLSVNEITTSFLRAWVEWMPKNPTNSTRGFSSQGVGLAFSKIRALHNRAKKEFNDEEIGRVLIPYSPFSKVELPTIVATDKRAITLQELSAISSLPDVGSAMSVCRDIFLLSFGLMGMNAVDLYNAERYEDGRIIYERTKTKTRRADRALISVKVEPELMPLFEKYRDESGNRVFRFYKMWSSDRVMTTMLSRGIRQIKEFLKLDRLVFYSARHTWATIAVNEAGVDKYAVHSALNHVDPMMKVTDMYIKKSWAVNDAANRAVLDYVNIFGG